MKFERNLTLTKYLIILSFVCSIISIFTSAFDKGEIYPFYHFKLYSQPLGANHSVTEYRIYARPTINSTFKRININESESFDYNSYVLTFNNLMKRYSKNDSEKEKCKNQLKIFVNHIIPNQAEYKIVEETYQPLEMINSNKYDTTTVVTF